MTDRRSLLAAAWLAACTFDQTGVGEGVGTETGSGETTSFTLLPTTATSVADSEASSGTTDPTTDGTTADDGGGPPQLGPFGMPAVVAELSDPVAIDDDPTLRADQLEILFASTRLGGPGGEDIWSARRDSVDEPFGAPEPELVLDSVFGEAAPDLSADGRWVSFASDRVGGEGLLDVWVSARADVNAPWAEPVRVDELSSATGEGSVVTTMGDLVAYLCRFEGGSDEIFTAVRGSVADPWGPPTAVIELQTVFRDCTPWIDPSGTLLLFTTDRPGGLGFDDIWWTVHDGSQFAPAVPLTDVNSAVIDEDPWLAPDGAALWFSSSRGGGSDIWVARRME